MIDAEFRLARGEIWRTRRVDVIFLTGLDLCAQHALDFFDEARVVLELPDADAFSVGRHVQLVAWLRQRRVAVNEPLQRTVRAVGHESS